MYLYNTECSGVVLQMMFTAVVVALLVFAVGGAVLCELCSRLFHERVDYKHHFKRRHLGQFNIRCDACYKGFWKTNALRQHTCYPEMHDENMRLQREREEAALRQRSEVRTSMGLGEGGGIDVVDVVDSKTIDSDAGQLQESASESQMVDTSSPSDSVIELHSSHLASPLSTSQNVSSETTAELVPAVSDNCHSNTSTDHEADALLSHGYGTRRKRISFRHLLQCS